MNSCRHCGSPLKGNEKVCPKCGAALTGGKYMKAPQKPKRKSWVWLPIALIVALAVVAGGLFLTGSHDDPLMQTEPVTSETTVPTTETTAPPTTETTAPPTTEPPPVYRNPLNGQILDAPYTGRIFACTISNVPGALPHVNATKADVVFEAFVNQSIIRCVGLYTDISKVEKIGSVRSTRLIFNDVAQHYDAVMVHAGGSDPVLADAKSRGIDHFNIDAWVAIEAGCSERDEYRRRHIGWEHSLLALGPKVVEYAGAQGYRLTQDPEKDYGFRFTEEATPTDGEDAAAITITITQGKHRKDTVLNYDPELGKYAYSQYGKVMKDGLTEETEAYTNIIVMHTQISLYGPWQQTDFLAGGDGYFACGGKIIPIKWGCDGDDQPLWFTTMDGEPLEMGVGNTYIAITEPGSKIVYE